MMFKFPGAHKVFISSTCKSCQQCATVDVEFLCDTYVEGFEAKGNSHLHVLCLTDCSNCFAAISNVGIRCSEKTAKVQLCFLRDMQKLVTISYVSGLFNIADVGTKDRSNVELLGG